MIFYKLLAPVERSGTVVRAEKRNQQEYIRGRGWVDSGVMLEYFWPGSDVFEAYEEISEEEAARLTAQ